MKDVIKVIGEINVETLEVFMEETDLIINTYKQYKEDVELIKDEYVNEFNRITVEISSYGGCTDCGSAMVDRIMEMQQMGIHVDTKCNGMAYSMAFILFIVGERRSGGKLSKYMNHASSTTHSGFVEKIKNDVAFSEQSDNQFDSLILKQTNMPKERLEMAKLKNDWIFYDEAIELGIVNYGYEGSEESNKEITENFVKGVEQAINVFGKATGIEDKEECMATMFKILAEAFGIEVYEDVEVKEENKENKDEE